MVLFASLFVTPINTHVMHRSFCGITDSDGFETRHHQNRQKSLKIPKGIIRRCKSKKDVQCNGLDNKAHKKDKQ